MVTFKIFVDVSPRWLFLFPGAMLLPGFGSALTLIAGPLNVGTI